MSISVDANILIWGIKKQASENRRDMIPRAARFFDECRARNERLYLPSHALAEFLAGYDDDKRKESLAVVVKSFFIMPFDANAANIAAEIFYKHAESINAIKSDFALTKQMVKVDIAIIATAIAARIDYICTEDAHMAKLAHGRISVKTLPASSNPVEASGAIGEQRQTFIEELDDDADPLIDVP